MEIKKEFRNELFKRKEILIELYSEKNPGFNEIKKIISEEMKFSKENLDMRGVKGGFGKKSFVSEVYVYDNKEDLENMKKLEMTKKQRKDTKEKKDEESNLNSVEEKASVEEKVEKKTEEVKAPENSE